MKPPKPWDPRTPLKGVPPSSAVRATAKAPKAEVEEVRNKVVDLISKDPRKAAIILTEWLKAADSRPTSRKKAS